MNIFINILAIILCLIIGYIFGSIPVGVIIGKLKFHQDPRDYGSHNCGGTNCGRLWGLKWGFLVIILDMLKTIGLLWAAWAILTFIPMYNGLPLCPTVNEINSLGANTNYGVGWPVYYLVPIGGILGHCFPIFDHFKGGKGVSTYMGVSITTSWALGLIPGISYFLILKIKKTVSIASLFVPLLTVIISWIFTILGITGVIPTDIYWIFMYGPTMIPGLFYSIMLTILAAILIIRHIPNIKRIKNGEESKIKWMK